MGYMHNVFSGLNNVISGLYVLSTVNSYGHVGTVS